MTETPVVITGLMGAGKTTIARLVAEALGREMRDSDEDLAKRWGRTAAELNAEVGADELHRREAEMLKDALAADPPVVTAAAASTVEDAGSRAVLAPAFTVFLDGDPAMLAERMKSSGHRPHFEDDLQHMLTKMRTTRLPYFLEVADLVLPVTGTPDEIVAKVLAAYRESRA